MNRFVQPKADLFAQTVGLPLPALTTREGVGHFGILAILSPGPMLDNLICTRKLQDQLLFVADRRIRKVSRTLE